MKGKQSARGREAKALTMITEAFQKYGSERLNLGYVDR